jgi:hypothetical protein
VTLRQWSIGLNLDKDALITDVFEGLPAAKAGIGPGMTLIAVNGKRFTPDVLDQAMVETKVSQGFDRPARRERRLLPHGLGPVPRWTALPARRSHGRCGGHAVCGARRPPMTQRLYR